jgi:cytochrome c-type biogenesis protein CcsB
MDELTWVHSGILCLLASLFFYVVRQLSGKGLFRVFGWWSMAGSVGCLITSLVLRSLNANYFALSNMYESLLVLVLWMQVGFLVMDHKVRSAIFAWPVVLLLLATVGCATTLSTDINPLQAALQSYWRSIHVPIIISSYAMFSLAFVSAILHLIKSRHDGGGSGGGSALLADGPALDSALLFEEMTYRFVSIGFPLLTIGIILGGMWANEAWGNYWSWDPKESMSLVTLLGYGVYLHLRVNGQHSPRLLSVVSIVGFVLMLVTYFGVNLMGVGLHSYGKIG